MAVPADSVALAEAVSAAEAWAVACPRAATSPGAADRAAPGTAATGAAEVLSAVVMVHCAAWTAVRRLGTKLAAISVAGFTIGPV